jgi:hypothetical protein
MKRAGNMTFVTVYHAGHTCPGDAPESVAFMVKCWITGSGTYGWDCPWIFSWFDINNPLNPNYEV